MSDRFYTQLPLSQGEFVLHGNEAHHLGHVRRFVPGDRLTLFNGDGREYPAEVLSLDRRSAVLMLSPGEFTDRESPIRIEVFAAMPKGDRGDFLIEKLVELGVSRFTPLLTQRTIVQPKDSRLERLQQIVVEASKQCGRNILMEIGPLTRWTDVAESTSIWTSLLLHPVEDKACSGFLNQLASEVVGKGVRFAIGPEGGFTDDEVSLAQASRWERISLGPRILRVETAAIFVASWVMSLNSR